jgi:hypothetical protein
MILLLQDHCQSPSSHSFHRLPDSSISRHLNREEGMYWLCDILIEHIFQQVSSIRSPPLPSSSTHFIEQISVGNIFLDTNQQHLHSLRLKLKNETKAIRKCREDGFQTVTVTKKIAVATPPIPVLTVDLKTTVDKPVGGTISKTRVKKLDIMERLNLAKQEAILERKMDHLNEDILRRSKQETIDKTMKFLKKLPGISTTQQLGSTVDLEGNDRTEENLKRSSSTPALTSASSFDPNSTINRNESGSFDETIFAKTAVCLAPGSSLLSIDLSLSLS